MEFLGYFGGVFEPLSFLLLLVGTIGGLILGAVTHQRLIDRLV